MVYWSRFEIGTAHVQTKCVTLKKQCDDMDCIHVGQDRNQWWSGNEPFGFIKRGISLD